MTITQQDEAVLDYYAREARGVAEPSALAGLTLATFRAARHRLVVAGALVRDPWGQYVPVGAVTA